MSFFQNIEGDYYLNSFANNKNSDRLHYAYIIPKSQMKAYIFILYTAMLTSLLSLAVHTIYLIYTISIGGELDHLKMAYTAVASTASILLIALRNFFFKVKKVSLNATKLNHRPSVVLYYALFFGFLNASIGFGVISMSNSGGVDIGLFSFFSIFSFLTIVFWTKIRTLKNKIIA